MNSNPDNRTPFSEYTLDSLIHLSLNPGCILPFCSNEQLCDYIGNGKLSVFREKCVAELFVREFLKKGSAKKEINGILTDGELESFWRKVGEDFLDIHAKKPFPLEKLWDSANEFSRICEIAVRGRLTKLCEDTDGFIPVFLKNGTESFFIPFHFKHLEKTSKKGQIVDLAGSPIQAWQPLYERLFPEGKYWCVVRCDQEGLNCLPDFKVVLEGKSLMLPLYLAWLRKEGKLEYNPLRLVATGEIEKAGHLKSVRTKEKADGFHHCFDWNSLFVFPESSHYRAVPRYEMALPEMNLDQLEEYFRASGFFVRSRKKNAEDFCTITPEISDCFVGRRDNLMELNRLLIREHRIPVISGVAGVGKSELAVAYATIYADEFPQGRFMIPMEGVHTWADAMDKMIEQWCKVCDLTSPEQLGLPKDFNSLPPDEKKKKAFGKLAKRAQNGRLLLLLDNLEDLDLLSNHGLQDLTGPTKMPVKLHVIATTRLNEAANEKGKISVRPPVKLENLENLEEDDALDFFCKICKGAFSFPKYPIENGELALDSIPEDDRPDKVTIRRIEKEYAELKKTIGLLKCHVWSMEIVAARFDVLFQFGECDIQKECAEINNDILSYLKGRTYRNNGEDAEHLLKPTLDLILKQDAVAKGLGQKIMRLAYYASFFPPEQIPIYALKGLWEQEFGDAVEKEVPIKKGNISVKVKACDYAVTLLKRYRIINGNGPILKMHRLTREVLLKRMSERGHTYDIIPEMLLFFQFALFIGVESESDSVFEPFLKTDFEYEGFSSLPKKLSIQQLQPICGWVNHWWREIAFKITYGYAVITKLIRECMSLNMYAEAKQLLSLDFQSITTEECFLCGYYEVKGLFYLNQKLFENAEEDILKSKGYYQKLRKIERNSEIKSYSLGLVRDLRNLAFIHHVSGQDKTAEKELRDALGISRTIPKHPDAEIEVRTDLANLYCDLNQYKRAENQLNKALKIHKRGWISQTSSDKPYYPETLKTLAKLHSSRGEYEEAKQALIEALEKYRCLDDERERFKPYVADTRSMLAEVYHKQALAADENEKAELLDCLGIYRELSKNNPTVYCAQIVKTLNALAILYQKTGQTALAEENWIECLEINCEHLLDNPELYSRGLTAVLDSLSSAQFDLTRHDEIKKVLSRLENTFHQLADDDPLAYNSIMEKYLDLLADVQEIMGRVEDAEMNCQAASDLRGECKGGRDKRA